MSTIREQLSQGVRVLNYLYGNGYVLLKTPKKPDKPCYILDFSRRDGEGVDEDDDVTSTDSTIRVRGEYYTAKGSKKSFSTDLTSDAYSFVLEEPVLGIVNTGLTVCLTRRVPIRKYTRVLTPSSLDINPMYLDILEDLGKNVYKSCLALVRSNLFNDTYLPIDESLYLVSRGSHVASAFSNAFYFANLPNYDDISVGYKDVIVGYYSAENATVMLEPTFKHLRESLSEHIKTEVI